MQGRKRQDEVWRIYVTQDDASAPFFDTLQVGRKIFSRHHLNNRNEVSHRAELKEKLLQYGFAKGVRGSAWGGWQKGCLGK